MTGFFRDLYELTHSSFSTRYTSDPGGFPSEREFLLLRGISRVGKKLLYGAVSDVAEGGVAYNAVSAGTIITDVYLKVFNTAEGGLDGAYTTLNFGSSRRVKVCAGQAWSASELSESAILTFDVGANLSNGANIWTNLVVSGYTPSGGI